MANQDTEITLGTGKPLGIFVALVALCAVFLGIGYSLGKNSVKTTTTAELTEMQPVSKSGPKPGSAATARQVEGKPDLTFYKAVEKNEPDSKLNDSEESAPRESEVKTTAAPELSRPGSGYVVQVAAVSKQEDAQALAEALRKKSYAVVVSAPANDKLFHVQVGPFNDIADAESTKTRLVSDGYNPILKK